MHGLADMARIVEPPRPAVKKAARTGEVARDRGQRLVVPAGEDRRQELRGRRARMAQDPVGDTRPVDRHRDRAAHAHVGELRQAGIERHQPHARDRHACHRHGAGRIDAGHGGGGERVDDIGIPRDGDVGARVAVGDTAVTHAGDACRRAAVALEAFEFQHRLAVDGRDPVGARRDDLLHAAVGCEGARCEDDRGVVAQERRQDAEDRLGPQHDGIAHHRKTFERDRRQTLAAECGLEAGRDRFGRHFRAVVELEACTDRETPGQLVRIDRPARRHAADKGPVGFDLHQRFGNAQTREDVAGVGRIVRRVFPRRNDAQDRFAALGEGAARRGEECGGACGGKKAAAREGAAGHGVSPGSDGKLSLRTTTEWGEPSGGTRARMPARRAGARALRSRNPSGWLR